MIDSANSVLQGIVNQIEFTYDEPDGTVIATENPDIEDAYNLVVERAIPNSAYAGQWSDDWNASMANGEFAAMLCPGWMLGIISGNAPDVTGWEVANVFPNGGGNWGGSYLTVPANGKNVEAALALADWLTAPEQQVKAFVNAGTFPSQIEAHERPGAHRLDERVLQRRADRPDLRRARRGGHGRPLQERGLLQVPPGAPERRHPGLRRHSKTSRPRGTPRSPRSKPSDRSEREWGSRLAARPPLSPAHPSDPLARHRRYGAPRDRDRYTRDDVAGLARSASRSAPPPRHLVQPQAEPLGPQGLALPLHLPVLHPVRDRRALPDRLHRRHLVPGMGPGAQHRRRSSASTSTSGS